MKKYLLLLLIVAIANNLQAQNPYLVKDGFGGINYSDSSDPDFSTALGTISLFIASDNINGRELWKTDGTAAGTVLVKDINPGTASSYPNNFMVLGGNAYFCANDGVNGNELWKSDGTAAGTQLVKVINAYDFEIRLLFVFHDYLYFTSDDGNGTQLWRTDGTESGTVPFKNINPRYYYESGSAVLNDVLYFSATDGINGDELWKTDGTEAGTVMVKDIQSGASSSNIGYLTLFNGAIYFSAFDNENGGELWKSDGTDAGTVILYDIVPGTASSFPRGFKVFDNNLFFNALDPDGDRELWKTDGTTAGTVLFKDIYVGGSSNPEELTVLGNTMYFRATDENGTGLWKTDGTAAGTVQASVHYPIQLSVTDTHLYFAESISHLLWRTDGTTIESVTINGADYSYKLGIHGNTMYFSAGSASNGRELWKIDGTGTEAVMVKDIANTAFASDLYTFQNFNGTLFFKTLQDDPFYNQIWKSDGSASGTTLVANSEVNVTEFKMLGNNVFYNGYSDGYGVELWKANVTTGAAAMVKDINPDYLDSNTGGLTVFGNSIFFRAVDDSHAQELWKTDGTEAGTILVKDINPGSTSSNLTTFTAGANALYFSANNGTNGRELWKSDGTEAGTIMVKDINPGTANSLPSAFFALGNTMFFRANDGFNGFELWKTDGTEAGTVMVKDINAAGSSNPALFFVLGSNLYFQADDGINGFELWKTDGTTAGTMMVKDINTAGNSTPGQFSVLGNNLYFQANDGINGIELWKTDGTTAGTVMVKDISASDSSNPTLLTTVGGHIYFAATNDTNGRELWKTDGTAAGTVLVNDINPGTNSSDPINLVNVNGKLFFAANASDGFNLWALAPIIVNMTPSYNNMNLPSLSTAVPAVLYTYPGATSLKYRFSIKNLTTNTTAPDIIQTSRYVTIPASLHTYNAQYTITASAVIDDVIFPFEGNTITVNSPSLQLVTLNSANCGATLASLSSTLTSNPGLNAISYTFRVRVNDSNPTPTYAYSQSATRFVGANSFTGFPLQYSSSYKVSVQYTFIDPVTNLPVDSGYGAECTVNTPSIPLIAMASPTCGSQVSTLNSNISAAAASYASGYQFRIRLFADNGPTPTYYYTPVVASRFSSLTAFQGITLTYNTPYSISVQYSVVNGGTIWSGYGPECKVTTPFFPTTSLVPSQCGLSTATLLTQQLNITPYPGFPHYKVLLEEVSGEDVINSQEREIAYSHFKLSDFSIAQLDKNYQISVAIKLNGVFGDYSTACDLFTASSGGNHGSEGTKIQLPFKAIAYPNPFANNFNLDIKTSSQSMVNVKVYDIVGRLIEQRNVSISDLKGTSVGDNYPTGVYNVVVSQEDQTSTVRVVKR
ncbi:ELWxxDGT repeat protein [Flavobacterium wongokense]|uniref:ELWxxDGT repeat protein n=1 Tax=Flavobacterium wongokense TaxID=2910674 RepID=UPI001F3F029B|nr:ELWxxDGT repeat protein [Flavobacterium sp. WG47]MCF6130768.1 DUF5050 domain-containing protein [Flavobacterium sp. WG47]